MKKHDTYKFDYNITVATTYVYYDQIYLMYGCWGETTSYRPTLFSSNVRYRQFHLILAGNICDLYCCYSWHLKRCSTTKKYRLF